MLNNIIIKSQYFQIKNFNKIFINLFVLFIFNMFPSDPKGSLDAFCKLFHLNQSELV